MANRSETVTDRENRIGDVATLVRDRYELVALPLIMAFMFFTRYQSADNFRSDDGFYLAAIDSYYHWRTTMYTVENWPNTMPFDVWTAWSEGRYVGQFGTAFDQIIATVALIIGLGDPSETIVHETVLFMIPFLAALVAIPIYFIGKRLGGRIAGVASVALLALFPGEFFIRSTVGQHQHHIAEALFMAIAILAFMVALRTAEREKPVWELVLDRDLKGLQTTIITSALAGAALAFYMWMWPAGMLLIGILGIFFVVYLSIEYTAGRSPEHLAFVGVIAFVVTGILMLGQIEEMSTSSTSFGYLAPLLSFAVAGGSVFMAAVARIWDDRKYEPLLYPVGIVGSAIVASLILDLLVPGVISSTFDEFLRRMTPLGDHVTDRTIQEANPPADFGQQAFSEFGLAFYAAVVGLIGLIVAPFLGRQARAEHALIVIWALILVSMAATQIRFWYYLAIAVAVLNAYLIGLIVEWVDIEAGIESVRDIEGYQIIVLATVVMILVLPLTPIVAAQSPQLTTVVDRGQQVGPHGDTLAWHESLEYIESSTPDVGHWGDANSDLEYYGAFERPPDENFEYPEGAYGVISWWDYGHLITVKGERIPHSNPFQTNARSSAAFLLADSEERGSLILDAIPTGESIQGTPTEELRDVVADRTEQEELEETRYVMIDAAMVGSKFGAITDWDDQERADFTEMAEVQTMTGQVLTAQTKSDEFYNTMAGGLFYGQADEMEHYRMVHESTGQTTMASAGIVGEGEQLEPFMVNVQIDTIIQQLNRLGVPIQSFEQLMGMEQLEIYDVHQVPEVRTFERVEGATISGTVTDEDAEEVFATLPLNTTTTEQPFQYSQSVDVNDDGSFEITVPYPTTEELGVEDGYTESTVFAEEEYSITVVGEVDGNLTELETGSVDVPEPGIYEGETYEVTLEEVEDEDEFDEDEEETDADDADDGDVNDARTLIFP